MNRMMVVSSPARNYHGILSCCVFSLFTFEGVFSDMYDKASVSRGGAEFLAMFGSKQPAQLAVVTRETVQK